MNEILYWLSCVREMLVTMYLVEIITRVHRLIHILQDHVGGT